jgi:protein gp37
MADVFEDHPVVEQEREKLWLLIEQTPMLNWLLLTKRPQSILSMVPWSGAFPDNVWIGTSVENQRRADERVPLLLEVPAVVRFLSCEPLLEAVDLSAWLPALQWIICGGESGPSARPMAVEWARSLRDVCVEAGVPYFFKQWGGRTSKAGGRLLDGQLWDEVPLVGW